MTSDAARPAAPGEARPPFVIVISGPGGVGKGTVVRELMKRDPKLWLSRSWTTRPPRPGEDPDAYRFVTRQEFDEHIERDGFLEWVDFLDYRQGTPHPDPPAGSDVVLEIDVVGARAVSSLIEDALCVFIDAPSPAEQEMRLFGRGDAAEKVVARMAKGAEERRLANELGAEVVVNDEVDRTVEELRALIDRRRRSRGQAPSS